MVFATVTWAGNTIAGRLAVDEISPLMLVSLRWVWVIGGLWPFYGAEVRAHWGAVRPRLRFIVLMATFGFTVFNVLYYYAAHTTSAVNLGILQGSMPMFVMVGAFVMLGSRPSAVQWVGALVTTLGVLMVATQGNPLALIGLEVTRGDWLVLLACLFYSLYTVGLRDRPAMPGPVFFTILAAIAAVTSLPLIAFEWAMGELRLPTPTGWLIALYVAIFPSCLAQLFFLRGVDLLGPARSSVFLNLVPVLSAVLAVALLGEPFHWFHGAAMVLVIGGIWIAERGKSVG